tara:strand:- start:4022 stop:7666 length:3645 start_codon:yes stop_codon:yes gene_type:complete
MSLLRADKITNRFKNSGPIIVGPSSVTGDFTVSGILTALGIGVTNDVLIGGATTTKFLTAQNSANLFNTTLTGVTTVGVITGGTYFGNGVNLTGIVTSIAAGAGVFISPASGQGRVTINANNVAVAGFAVTAGVSTNLKGGASGVIPYQSAVNTTAFTGVGNTGEILLSQGANTPVWTSLAAINVSFASSAGVSTNLKGGSAGKLPIQTAPDTTGFLPVGVTGNILLAQGTSNPIYIDPKASLDVRRARFAGIATNLQNGFISNVTSLEVVGVTTLGVTTAKTLDVTGITTTDLLNVSTAATITNLTLSTGPGVAVTAILDEDDLVSNRADALVTQQSIKAYVDSQVTAQDLDGNADSGTFVVDLDSQELGVRGTSNEVITVGAGQSVTVGLDTNVTIPNNLTVTTNSQVNGISSVGSAITMYGATGIVSATAFYGDGTNLTNVLGIGNSVTNIVFVSPDGDDTKDGRRVSTAKRTVGSALTIAEASTVIRISAGNYSENNPLILPEQVTILGDSLREVSLSPQNANQDFIYVANGSYVENISFTGTLNEGKAIIAFNPDKPSFVTQGPYIRNCTNFITNSIGMKIDGASVIGPTRAMNVDSYTQLNQGGIGVSISNEGYAQLVSIFTIYNDQSIICINGGQCDLTNSNSSFGRFGLVADGIGPTNFIGTITTATAANSDVFPIDLSTETLSIENALYDAASGLTTITTYKAHGYNQGMSVNLAGLGFSCRSYDHTFVSGVNNAITDGNGVNYTAQTGTTYNQDTGALVLDVNTTHGLSAATALTATTGTGWIPSTGILTVVTTAAHGLTTNDYVKFATESLTFSCTQDGNATNHAYPRQTDPVFNKWIQVTVTNATTFTCSVGVSTTGDFTHTFVSATAGGVLKANDTVTIADNGVTFTCDKDNNTSNHSYPRPGDPASGATLGIEAVTSDTFTVNVGASNIFTFPSGNFGNIFTVSEVVGINTFKTFVGFSTLTHVYNSGGNTNTFVTRPYDGQVVYVDSIFNSINGVTITNGGSGYTSPPAITFSDPSESWGIRATANAVLTNGVVTSVDMISNGRGYTGSPTVTIAGAASGTPNLLPTYYVVSSATPIVGGISTVTFTERVPYAVGVGSTVPFFKQSRVLASSHAFEYIGSGNTFPDALPARGGVAIPENEIVNKNGGLVIFTSTDQAGNFKIGDGVVINQLEGSISGDAYNRSLFANITPYILALGGGD